MSHNNMEEKSITFQIPTTELSSSEGEESSRKKDKINIKTERR